MAIKSIPLRELKADSFFSAPVYIDERYILLTPEIPLSPERINLMAEFEIREVFTEGEAIENEPLFQSDEDTDEDIDTLIDIAASKAGTLSADKAITVAAAVYRQFLNFTDNTYKRYINRNEIQIKEISEQIKILNDFISVNRRLVLRAISEAEDPPDYIVSHSARSTVIAIVLGQQVKLPPHRIIELGIACLLHEIGMVRLPPHLYMSNKKLEAAEFKAMTTHPILGYNILKEKQMPLSICLAALEHHERLNGSGYPRGLAGDRISLYSKIIAVACSYDALTTKRPYREARDGHVGIIDLLKNEGKGYDELIIRALVYSLSLYPIGSYVLLTNSRHAQVVDVNPQNPRYPIVRLIGVHSHDGKDALVQTAEDSLRILRPLSKNEVEKHIKQ